MQCLILAGGLGTRIKTITGDKPKALLEIGPQTFIDWQLQWLKILGVTDVVLALGHGSEQIVEHVESKQKNKAYPQVNYSFDGPELLGTGGAIRNASKMLSENFIVTYGDTILLLDIKKMIQTHLETQKPVTLSILNNKNRGDRSNVIYKNGEIKLYDKFNITDEMEYIDYGMSVLNKKYFLMNAPEGKFDFSLFLTASSKEKQIAAFLVTEHFMEVGSVEGFKNFGRFLMSYNYDLRSLARSKNL